MSVITLKLRYESVPEFQKLLQGMRVQQSIAVRSSFKGWQEGLSNKEIYAHLKTLNGLDCMDSWWMQSAVSEAKTMYSSKKDSKVVFGGKSNLRKLHKKQITKQEYKQSRLMHLTSTGEANQKGNRKFRLDVANNKIVFKDCGGKIKYDLCFKPQLRDRLEQLLHIEDATKEKRLPLSVKVDEEFIYLTFEPKKKEIVKKIQNRVLAIDSNPNSIGWSVVDVTGDEVSVVDSGVIELTELNKRSKQKKEHETFEISKFLVNKAVHYKCEMFAVEDLTIQSKDHCKGRKYNKTVNNDWLRTKLFNSIQKRCFINNIIFKTVNAAFTSIIGGTLHRSYPDPIAPTFEIARRAVHKYQKSKFYPALPGKDVLNEQWKQTLEQSFKSWRELADWLKNTKYRYRVSLEAFVSGVFRLKSSRSTVTCRYSCV
jgi:hypothetical protein